MSEIDRIHRLLAQTDEERSEQRKQDELEKLAIQSKGRKQFETLIIGRDSMVESEGRTDRTVHYYPVSLGTYKDPKTTSPDRTDALIAIPFIVYRTRTEEFNTVYDEPVATEYGIAISSINSDDGPMQKPTTRERYTIPASEGTDMISSGNCNTLSMSRRFESVTADIAVFLSLPTD